MEDIIHCWNLCKIDLVKDNGETKWRGHDGSLQPLTTLRVNVLYKRLGKPDQIGKNKLLVNVTDKEWLSRWEYFNGSKHMGPSDKQLRYKIHQAKLWCGPNRKSKGEDSTCPSCGNVEQQVDHALTTDCPFTGIFFRKIQRIWLSWSNTTWEEVEWNNDWIEDATPWRDQKDMLMVTAKRILWHNYTNGIFNDTICDIEGLLAKWMGAIKYKITGKLWLCNATEEKDIDGWDLNGQLAQFSEERWTIIKDSFMISS
jgi:hypothetical protein